MEIKRQLIRLFFVACFTFPILFLVFFLNWDFYLSPRDVWRYFSQSFMQALLSSTLITVFGFLFCFGLMGTKQSERKWWVAISVLPAFAPTIFVVVSFQTWIHLLQVNHAEGILLVSFVHGLMNLGLAGTLFFYLIESGLKNQASLAYLEGSSRFRILKELLLSKKNEILIILFSFFGLCFTSFAIPLILGGSRGGTLEILAYRQISEQGDLFGAFVLMIFQWFCFYIMIRPLSQTVGHHVKTNGDLPESIGFRFFGILGLLATVICLGGMFLGWAEGLSQFSELLNSGFSLLPLWWNSIFIALAAATMSLIFYLLLTYLWVDQQLHRFIIGFGSVSSVLLGLGLFVLPIPDIFKLGLGLTVLFFPFAYRIFGASNLMSLSHQVEVAGLLGASRFEVFESIVGPQALPSALRLSGVVAFWVIGEYALSSVVTGELLNLSLLAKSFMLGYRIELAVILNWIILLSGGVIFLAFMWGADVCRRKLEV